VDENNIANRIIGAAIAVHRVLGPGLLESAYHAALCRELELQGFTFESEFPIVVEYKGRLISPAYRGDLLVNNRVIVEIKSVDKLKDIHRAQLLTYLRLTNRRLGLLINFNTTLLKQGIQRVVNKL